MRLPVGLLAASLIATMTTLTPAPATAEVRDDTRAQKAFTWLSKQTGAGGMLESVAGYGNPGLTLDGVLAGAAARGSKATTDAWMQSVAKVFPEHALADPDGGIPDNDNGLIGKTLLTLSVTGRTTTSFAGTNPRELATSSLTGSGESGWSKGTNAFGQSLIMLGLARSGTLPAATVTFIPGKQCSDGGFPMYFQAGRSCAATGAISDPDGTAMVVMALRAAQAKGNKAAAAPLNRAVKYLKARQLANGSYESSPLGGKVANSNTTGLVAAALADLDSATTAKTTAWVTTLQLTSGSDSGAIAYSASDRAAGIRPITRTVWTRATSQAILAFAPVTFYRLTQPFDVYTTPGTHTLNGRRWRTTCEPYSQTERCRTEIMATTIRQRTSGAFYQETAWVFNNLTYLPSKRSIWVGNGLGGFGKVGYTGTWTKDGRAWRTECDTPLSGGNGCRSYIQVSYITNTAAAGRPPAYRWVKGYVFNNIARFNG